MKQRNPNPLEEALARSQRDEPHPDESALTAFAEGVLLKREREEVLAHLAVCCACRSVLGAAAAAAREHAEELHAAASVSGPKATGKASRPWFVWAGACAGILVAVTVAALVWQQHTTMEPRQDVATSTVPVQALPEVPPPPAVATTGKGDAARSAPVPGGAEKKAGDAANQSAPVPIAGGSNAVSSARVVPSTNADAVSAAPAAEMQALRQQAYRADSKVEQGQTTQTLAEVSAQQIENATLQHPAAPTASNALSGPLGSRSLAEAGVSRAIRPHWRINPEGRVERAFGDGPWERTIAQENARMRVVAVVGGWVWAGGEQSRLYRSGDNGETWLRIELPQKGSADRTIAHVRFQNAEAGTVEAEDGVAWSTTDGGRTWK